MSFLVLQSFLGSMCRSGVGGGGNNHRNIGFRNTGPEPLKNHNVTKPAFNVVPSLAHQQKAI